MGRSMGRRKDCDHCWMSQETVEVGLNTHLAALHLSRKAIASSGGKSTTM